MQVTIPVFFFTLETTGRATAQFRQLIIPSYVVLIVPTIFLCEISGTLIGVRFILFVYVSTKSKAKA